nr:GloSensor-21F cAMP biosensor [Expression vector pGloSensor-21F cAMP]
MPGAVGKVVPFIEAKVVDLDTGKTLGVNQRGELCVRGPMIMSGYVNNPEATNALIDKDGWLHSGDIAYWDEDEHFFIVDRLKSLIKYKGYQVAPAELESILLQHPNIFDAGVAGLPDDDAGELPAAVVVLEHGKTMTEKEIVDYVASQVTTAKKLRGGVVLVDEVPKGLTGKLDARKIREILIKAKKGSIAGCGDAGEGMYESFIESLPFLKSLEFSARLKVVDVIGTKVYNDGEQIIAQGDSADSFFIIESGEVKITMKRKGKSEVEENGAVEIARCSRGQYFGELALVTNKPRAASAHAIGTVKCLAMDVQAFERLLGPCMEIMKRNIATYEEQLVALFGTNMDIVAKNIKKGPAPFYPLEDGTAGEQLHKAMKRYALVPGTIAFTDAHIEVDITYAEYFEMSVRLAEAMKRYGLNTNHRIVVCSENSLQFFMPVLGALFIGVAVAPANDIYNERELLNSMGISQPTVVFVSKKGLQKILNVQKKLPIIQKIIIMDSKTDYQGFQSMYTFVTSHLPPGFNEYDFVPESFDRDKTIALIMNSSGSTGLPKGVALPHRTACVRFSHARDPIFGNQIIPDTAILSVVPFHHGFGMFTTLGYLICGFRVVLMYRFEEELFLRSLQDYKIQSALLVPTLFSFFAKSTLIDKYDLSNLHEIASGGAPLSKEVGEAVAKRFHLPGIRQGYGLTETTSAILITPEGV